MSTRYRIGFAGVRVLRVRVLGPSRQGLHRLVVVLVFFRVLLVEWLHFRVFRVLEHWRVGFGMIGWRVQVLGLGH